MKTITDKTKRLLMIAGLGVICAALIAAISAQFLRQPPEAEPLLSSSEESREVIPIIEPQELQKEKEVVVLPPLSSSEAAVSSGTEQTIQPDPVKPSEPEKPVAQGDATNASEPPAYKPEDTVKAPSTSQPQGGERNDKGQVYFPGFGWIEAGGENKGITVGNPGDELTGNKVGSMD